MTAPTSPAWAELRDALARVQTALAEVDAERDRYAHVGRAVPPFIVKRLSQLRALSAEMGMVAEDTEATEYELRRSVAILNNALTYGVASPRAPHPLSTDRSRQLHHV